MAPRENNVSFEIFVRGDNVSSEKDAISRINRGKKKSKVYCKAGVGGYVLAITIRSNGSSKISGAATVPMMALPNAVFSPACLDKYAIPMKATRIDKSVTGLIGLVGKVTGPTCWKSALT